MRRAVRYVLAALFLLSAWVHVPSPFAAFEVLGAAALLVERWHRRAALFLILLLAAGLVGYAQDMIRAGTMWWRVPLQLVWMAAVGWSARLMKRKPMVVG